MDKTLSLGLYHLCKLAAFGTLGAVLLGQGQVAFGLVVWLFFVVGLGICGYHFTLLEALVSNAGLVVFAALAAIEAVPPLVLLPLIVCALMGWEFARFYARYRKLNDIDARLVVHHRMQVLGTGAAALSVGLLGLFVHLELGFWPVVGLLVLTLLSLLHLVRHASLR